MNTQDEKPLKSILERGETSGFFKGFASIITAIVIVAVALLKLWRMPWGIGVGIVSLVAAPWLIKAWWKTAKENTILRKKIKEIEKK